MVAAFHGEAGDLPDGLALGGGEGGGEGVYSCGGAVELGGIQDDEVFLGDAEGDGGVDGLRGGSAGGHADGDEGVGGEEDGVGFFDAGDEGEVAADDEASVGVGAVGGAGAIEGEGVVGGGGEGGGAVEVGVALGVGGGGVGVVGGVGFSDGGEEVGAEEGDLIARLAGVDAQAGADGGEGFAEVEGEGGVLGVELLADDFRLPVFGGAGEGAVGGGLAEGAEGLEGVAGGVGESVAGAVGGVFGLPLQGGGVGQGGADVGVGAGGYFKGKVEADGAVIGGDEQGEPGEGEDGAGGGGAGGGVAGEGGGEVEGPGGGYSSVSFAATSSINRGGVGVAGQCGVDAVGAGGVAVGGGVAVVGGEGEEEEELVAFLPGLGGGGGAGDGAGGGDSVGGAVGELEGEGGAAAGGGAGGEAGCEGVVQRVGAGGEEEGEGEQQGAEGGQQTVCGMCGVQTVGGVQCAVCGVRGVHICYGFNGLYGSLRVAPVAVILSLSKNLFFLSHSPGRGDASTSLSMTDGLSFFHSFILSFPKDFFSEGLLLFFLRLRLVGHHVAVLRHDDVHPRHEVGDFGRGLDEGVGVHRVHHLAVEGVGRGFAQGGDEAGGLGGLTVHLVRLDAAVGQQQADEGVGGLLLGVLGATGVGVDEVEEEGEGEVAHVVGLLHVGGFGVGRGTVHYLLLGGDGGGVLGCEGFEVELLGGEGLDEGGHFLVALGVAGQGELAEWHVVDFCSHKTFFFMFEGACRARPVAGFAWGALPRVFLWVACGSSGGVSVDSEAGREGLWAVGPPREVAHSHPLRIELDWRPHVHIH